MTIALENSDKPRFYLRITGDNQLRTKLHILRRGRITTRTGGDRVGNAMDVTPVGLWLGEQPVPGAADGDAEFHPTSRRLFLASAMQEMQPACQGQSTGNTTLRRFQSGISGSVPVFYLIVHAMTEEVLRPDSRIRGGVSGACLIRGTSPAYRVRTGKFVGGAQVCVGPRSPTEGQNSAALVGQLYEKCISAPCHKPAFSAQVCVGGAVISARAHPGWWMAVLAQLTHGMAIEKLGIPIFSCHFRKC